MFHTLKKIFKLKWYKAYRIIIFLICLSGFIYHNVVVFQEIIKSDLVNSGYFEKLSNNFKFPNVIFCVNFDESKIDENYKYTGGYLDKLTENFTHQNVFRKIEYFNKTHWNTLDSINFKNRNKEISFSYFYFTNLKCFEIELKFLLDEEDFFLRQHKNVIEIFFNETIYNQFDSVYYASRQGNSKVLTNFVGYKIGKVYINKTIYYHKYHIDIGLLKVKSDDKFEVLKYPINLFLKKRNKNDINKYLNDMKQSFESQWSLTTADILIEKNEKDFNYTIDDELFEQFFLEFIQNKSFTSFNYERLFLNVYSQISYIKDVSFSDFGFSFNFLLRQTESTNDDNYNKLVQSILNTLSLWLNVCILDLHIYLFILLSPVRNLYRYLIRFRSYLKAFTRLNYC